MCAQASQTTGPILDQAQAWYKIGINSGGGTVDGQQYTEQQCYIKALELND